MMHIPAFGHMHDAFITVHPRCIRLTTSRQLADLFTSSTLDSSCSTLVGGWEALPSRLKLIHRSECGTFAAEHTQGTSPRCRTRAPPLPRKCKSNMRIIAADASHSAPYAFCCAACSWMKLGCGVGCERQRWEKVIRRRRGNFPQAAAIFGATAEISACRIATLVHSQYAGASTKRAGPIVA
ncbi:hypothetical protein GY45DRAFT_751274 [Cubamyces sp. BRFM 1775]|nr:hypothetical protein GY45DRAFT_751274 [Cubamyces sp. BRFM 1775]